MTDVDTSFYPRPQPINPLTMFGNVQAIGGQMLANKQAQQGIQGTQMELNAKNALMQANAEATNPDGTIDTNKRNMLLSQLPGGGLHLQDEAVGALPLNSPTSFMGTDASGNPQQQYKSAQVMAAQLNPQQQQAAQTAHAKVDAMSDTINGLLQKPNLTAKDVCSATGDLCADGHLTPQEGAVELQGMPQSPDQIKGWLMGHYQTLKQSKASLNQIAPQGSAPAPTTGQQTPPALGMYTRPQVSGPTVAAAPPVGYTSPLSSSRDTYNTVKTAAEAAPQMNAAYNEAINLNKEGAPTGTNIANLYQYAAKNIPGVAQGITDKAAQAQEIGKWMSQGLIANGMPGSDARLQELQHANLNPDQLPETIKELAPFFKAVSQGAIAKQKFYNQETGNGTDLSKEPSASQKWNQNYDPRWMEYDELVDNKAKRAFLTKHPDLIGKKQNYQTLQQMGVVK